MQTSTDQSSYAFLIRSEHDGRVLGLIKSDPRSGNYVLLDDQGKELLHSPSLADLQEQARAVLYERYPEEQSMDRRMESLRKTRSDERDRNQDLDR